MAITYRIELNDLDLIQLLDGLETRAESWERTAEYLRTKTTPEDEVFIVEECSRPEEADDIGEHYRSMRLLRQTPASRHSPEQAAVIVNRALRKARRA